MIKKKTMAERQHSGLHVPVLMYHSIINNNNQYSLYEKARYAISTNEFERQMSYLNDNNYITLSLSDLIHLVENQNHLNDKEKKYVLITFDDGYRNNYTQAFPVLIAKNLQATFFVIVNRIDSPGYMTWTQLMEMCKKGMTIQSHTLKHKPLNTIQRYALKQELIGSKKILERRLEKPVNFLSYPHGIYNLEIINTAKQTGYTGSCTSDLDYFDVKKCPFNINRIDVRKRYDLSKFIKILDKKSLFFHKERLNWRLKQGAQNILGIDNYNRLCRKLFAIQDFEA